jgi:DNA invertase Pin-like site-specific DNA recombinase
MEVASAPQAKAIEDACANRGWAFLGGVREPEATAGNALERPGLRHALERFQHGEADCLMVAQLERLTHSAAELGELLDRLAATRVRLVALDVELDTATAGGRDAARALTTAGGWQRAASATKLPTVRAPSVPAAMGRQRGPEPDPSNGQTAPDQEREDG